MGSIQKRRDRRRQYAELKDALRDLRIQLAAVNHQVSSRIRIRDVDLDCLDTIDRSGPLSPSALARRTGLHPATLTGILDRLERAGLVARERTATDRRGVVVQGQRARAAEMYQLYAGMNSAIDEICDGYEQGELAVIADFLRRIAEAGADAAAELSAAE
jgi:DNA-binding MarR family transcriptional regulator